MPTAAASSGRCSSIFLIGKYKRPPACIVPNIQTRIRRRQVQQKKHTISICRTSVTQWDTRIKRHSTKEHVHPTKVQLIQLHQQIPYTAISSTPDVTIPLNLNFPSSKISELSAHWESRPYPHNLSLSLPSHSTSSTQTTRLLCTHPRFNRLDQYSRHQRRRIR